VKLSRLVAALPNIISFSGGDPDITLITSDSRQVIPGALFVACPGTSVDGHRFIPNAVERGAVAVVGQSVGQASDLPYIQVGDAREALAHLSACWHDFPARKLVMIGVTGTDGKTTTVNLIHNILAAAGVNAGMISTVNALIGGQFYDTGLHTTTPDAPDVHRYLAQMVQAGQTHCVLETTSHGLAQHRVTACEFDIGVVTNITHEHLDFHGSFEAYRAAKARLFEMVSTSTRKGAPKVVVLNADDPSYEYLRDVARRGSAELSYGMATCALVSTLEVAYKPDVMRFVAVTPVGRIPLETSLVGRHNVYNVLAAVSAGLALRLPVDAIQHGVKALKAVPGRWERIDEGQDFSAIVDFAHTPNALEQALQASRQMTTGQVIVVFGSAGLRDVEKRRLMGRVAGRLADKLVITAEDPRTESLDDIMAAIAEGALAEGRIEGQDFWRIGDRAEAIQFAVKLARGGDIVVSCGKGHEQSMCFGTTEYPWDDRLAMRTALQRMKAEG